MQERLDRGARQRHRVTVAAALGRVRLQGLADGSGQSGELGFAFEPQHERLLVGKDVLAEGSAKRRQPLHDFAKPPLGRIVERRAGAAIARVITLDHPRLFGVQAGTAGRAPHGVDAPEQGGIGVNLVPMPRDLGRHRPLNLHQGIVGVSASKEGKHVVDALEGATAQLQRGNRIGECRWLRCAGNGGDLRLVLGERVRVSRQEVLGPNPGERRYPAGGGPVL